MCIYNFTYKSGQSYLEPDLYQIAGRLKTQVAINIICIFIHKRERDRDSPTSG